MKTKLNIKVLIGNLIFIAVLLLIITRFLTVWSGTGFPLNLISAGSMSPALMEGDIVAWVPADIEEIEKGDVIVFKSWLSWPDEKFIVHRVVEIKNVLGRPAFVTKGDANNWTDQAGPHIVEPYVTEKNFIGRTLSIGQQPLKIPFVGIFGIWINEGVNSLAQPTAEKGTLTYVGVFTPLTVSIILLLVLIFITPEKTATFKEKLRLYIFGFHTLNIRKTFLIFLIIFVVLLSFIHVFAYDSSSASLGIGEFPEDTSFKLGTISPGSTSHPRKIPVFNPGIFPVKGVIMGGGELDKFVDRTIFDLEFGKSKKVNITASVPMSAQNGSYVGNILVYSSPIWFLLPDEVIQLAYPLNAQIAVMFLDVISGFILTVITVCLIILVEFGTGKIKNLNIDLSWRRAHRLILKKGIKQRMSSSKEIIKQALSQRYAWITKINLAEIDAKKSIIASLVIIPLFLLLSSELLAMIIASITAGLVAYLISCKRRSKIVLASIITLIVAIIYLITKTSFYLIRSNYNFIEAISLGLGLTAIYLLILALFLIPLALTAWYVTHLIRNLKEQKEPLLILEGRCDL